MSHSGLIVTPGSSILVTRVDNWPNLDRFRGEILNEYDPEDKKQARGIWFRYKDKKKKDGKPYTVRDIWKEIVKAAEKGRWGSNKGLRNPNENTVRAWIKEDWAPTVNELPEDEIVLPWSDDWGTDPARIRTLSVLFDLASHIWVREKDNDQEMESEFPGFPKDVCDWAWNLSGFFDLTARLDGFVLLDFAYGFAGEGRHRRAFDEPMPVRDENYDKLMRWNKRHQDPDLTQRILDEEGVVSILIWEQANEDDMEWIVASKLKGGPLVMSAKRETE